ncbi:CBS domain-containing protein [Mesorhizobium sp. B2-3-5]|uniref:CBS domain-containing protein n=1 Tax=Mesorhizobium sp. B2-3-5 TaxID=2589958 RepID=UPI00112E909D|nr:CBS domain-containing protein [Mesorhizobium sp. B2-3-5]TPM26896.1 CBS domain-containing protein [Mesorhizobium sp. B2-3-5]
MAQQKEKDEMRIDQILRAKRPDVVVISPDASLQDAVTSMTKEQVGALVVVDQKSRLLGIVSERDIVHRLATQGSEALRQSVNQIMQTDLPVAATDDTVASLMRVMTKSRVRHVPVLSAGIVVGVVSTGDVVKSRLTEKTEENTLLQDLARAHLLAEEARPYSLSD